MIELKGKFEGQKHDFEAKSQRSTDPSHIKSPSMSHILSIVEMEQVALAKMSDKAVSYYDSATDDGITKEANNNIYQSILLRPRIFVDCTQCSTATTFIGNTRHSYLRLSGCDGKTCSSGRRGRNCCGLLQVESLTDHQ